ncbi:hypothetical protein BT96DRAFT_844734, partial [Gymnopus androsaceus JB14]
MEQDFESALRTTESQVFLAQPSAPEGSALSPPLASLPPSDAPSALEHTTQAFRIESASDPIHSTKFADLSESAKPPSGSLINTFRAGSQSTRCREYHVKPPLNRRSRRRLAKEVQAATFTAKTYRGMAIDKPLLEMKRLMARPPGCSFLGSKATETTAT